MSSKSYSELVADEPEYVRKNRYRDELANAYFPRKFGKTRLIRKWRKANEVLRIALRRLEDPRRVIVNYGGTHREVLAGVAARLRSAGIAYLELAEVIEDVANHPSNAIARYDSFEEYEAALEAALSDRRTQ